MGGSDCFHVSTTAQAEESMKLQPVHVCGACVCLRERARERGSRKGRRMGDGLSQSQTRKWR